MIAVDRDGVGAIDRLEETAGGEVGSGQCDRENLDCEVLFSSVLRSSPSRQPTDCSLLPYGCAVLHGRTISAAHSSTHHAVVTSTTRRNASADFTHGLHH